MFTVIDGPFASILAGGKGGVTESINPCKSGTSMEFIKFGFSNRPADAPRMCGEVLFSVILLVPCDVTTATLLEDNVP